MSKNDQNWKLITLPFDEDMHDALQQQHHAAQFLALAGRHLISQQPDDSNTNMRFLSERNMLVGNSLANGLQLALQLTDLEIFLLNSNLDEKAKIALVGKTWQHVFQELKHNLAESGVDSSQLGHELHYEIPYHPILDEGKFFINDKKFFHENTIYRHNAETVLKSVLAFFEDAALVRIWPHHFDTATIAPLGFNSKGEISKFVGLGWAIPDSMVDEPYFYLSYRSEGLEKYIQDIPELEAGEWKMPEWNGAVLRHSAILQNCTVHAQFKLVKSFFESGITIQNYIN